MLCAEDSPRTKEQSENQYCKRYRTPPFSRHEPHTDIFYCRKEEGTENASPDVANTANNRCNNTFEDKREATRWMHTRIESRGNAGDTADCGSQKKYETYQSLRWNSNDTRHLLVVRYRSYSFAEERVAEDIHHGTHEYDCGDDNDDLCFSNGTASEL